MFAGRLTDRPIRLQIYDKFSNDPDFKLVDHAITSQEYRTLHQETKFCLCPHGAHAWSPRISEAVWYGCVPVILADYIDLPFSSIVPWSEMAVIIPERRVGELRDILVGIVEQTPERFKRMQELCWKNRKHLIWNNPSQPGDAFDIVMHELWKRRHFTRPSL